MTLRHRAQLAQFAALTLAAAQVIAAPPKPVVTLTTPATWADLDTSAVKGRPARLAWSDDRATLYLQTVEGETQQTLRFHHYLVRKGGKPVAPSNARNRRSLVPPAKTSPPAVASTGPQFVEF